MAPRAAVRGVCVGGESGYWDRTTPCLGAHRHLGHDMGPYCVSYSPFVGNSDENRIQNSSLRFYRGLNSNGCQKNRNGCQIQHKENETQLRL